MRGMCQLEVVHLAALAGQRNQVAPVLRIIRDLNGPLGGARNPIKLDAVEFATGAQVDRDPLLTGTRAHPSADEVVRAANLDALLAAIEGDLAEFPGHEEATPGIVSRDRGGTLDAIVAAAQCAAEPDGRLVEIALLAEAESGDRHGLGRRDAASLFPDAPIGRGEDGELKRLRLHSRGRGHHQVDPVDLGRLAASAQQHVNGRAAPAQIEGITGEMIGRESRARLWQARRDRRRRRQSSAASACP